MGALIKKAIGSNHYLVFLNRVRLRKKGGMGYPFLLERKIVHKELNLDDVEDSDLVQIDAENDDESEKAYSIIALWNWRQENYFIKKG